MQFGLREEREGDGGQAAANGQNGGGNRTGRRRTERRRGIRAWGFGLKTREGGPPQNIIIIILRPSKRGFESEEYKIINLIMGMDKSIESDKQ